MQFIMRRVRHSTRPRGPALQPFSVPPVQLVVCLVLALVTVVVFAAVCHHEFVAWDDDLNVYENLRLQSPTLASVLFFWRHPYEGLYIPLTYTLWSLAALLSLALSTNSAAEVALDPRFFHTLNLCLHLLCVVVVWRIVRLFLHARMPVSRRTAPDAGQVRLEWAACGGALLFAVHPLQVEAVAWVTGLKDVLCGLLALVAVWQYLHYSHDRQGSDKKSRAALHGSMASAAFVLALLAKPTAVVVPIIAWLLAVYGFPASPRRGIAILSLWVVLAGICGLLTRWVQPATALAFTPPIWARPLIAGDAVMFYLYKLGIPLWLGPDYGRSPEAVLAQGWGLLSGLVPWGFAVWLGCQRERVPWLVAAGGVFVAALLPVLGLISFSFQAYSTVADRYVYIAMLGPAVALAWMLVKFTHRLVIVTVVLCLALLGLRSVWQTSYWQNTASLFEHALLVNPESALAHNNLGFARARQGRYAEAMQHYSKALHLQPHNAKAHNNLGNALMRQGQLEKALHHYSEALRFENSARLHSNLGVALEQVGRYEDALRHHMEALRLQPDDPPAHNNLGNLFARQGQFAAASRHYSAALRLWPHYVKARYNLANALIRQGKIEESIHHYAEVVRLQPQHVKAHFGLAMAFGAQGNFQSAQHHLSEVLRIEPDHVGARQVLEGLKKHLEQSSGGSRRSVKP